MGNLNFDFHSMDSSIAASVHDDDYCYGLSEKKGDLWIPFLSFPITQTCNFHCIYCGIGGEATASKKQLISVSDIERIVHEAASKGVKKFRITGGEPFTHPDIDIILELMSKLGYFTLINSNGSLVSKHRSTIEKLNNNIHFAVSFDTLKPEVLKTISGISLHNEILDGIHLLSACGLLMRLNTVVSSYNYDEIYNIIDFCKELHCDLKLLDVVSVPVPYGRRNSFYREISTLENTFASTCDEILFHEYTRGFGTPCRRYRFDNVFVTIKNSAKGSHYDRGYADSICKNCPYYPCHEGLYDLFALSDGRICSCRWTEKQQFSTTSDQLDYLINAFQRSEYKSKNNNEDMNVRQDLIPEIRQLQNKR